MTQQITAELLTAYLRPEAVRDGVYPSKRMLFFICPIGVTVFITRLSTFLPGALVMFSSGFAVNVSARNDSNRSFLR